MPDHIAFKLRASVAQAPIESAPFHEWAFPDGTLWTQFYRIDAGYLLRFPGLADFTVSPDGGEVVAYPALDLSPQTVEHLYLNQVLPLALSRQQKFVLHGGAIELAVGAVAFLGVSGRGKSTLTASFATSGFRFLTDDGLQITQTNGVHYAQPSHASIRLWDDSGSALIPQTTAAAPPVDYTPKSRFLAGSEVPHCDEPRPLRAVYFLGEGNTDSIVITPVSGRDAMVELVRHSFLLDIEARDMLTRHFGQLADLVKTPMFFRLDYPRQYDLLPQVRQAVMRHVSLV